VTQPARDPNGASTWAAGQDVAAHTFVGSLDEHVEILGADGHHLQRVRRLRVGEQVTVADGRGTWRRYEIESAASGRLALRARSDRRVEPEIVPRVVVAMALTKAGALDTVVARGTELGVARFQPIRTRRCVVRWSPAQADRAVERLRVSAREASTQSRRARIPDISPVADLASLADRQDGVVVADRTGVSVSTLSPPARGAVRGDEWIVVVGPEGGLDPTELELLDRAPRVSLGPHILRAETAPIAAAALLLDRVLQLFREW
jgi:16S rRNA (uracil1498-N3)-methyltransferase